MSEESLSLKAREALRHIRNGIMHYGKVPSVRDLMSAMEYKSPRSAMLLMQELEEAGFLEKRDDGTYRLLKDLRNENAVDTVSVPLVGSVACGIPLMAQENIEAMIPVSTAMARPGSRYFLLQARGDSMNLADINDGDLLLIRQQTTANNGEKIVALINDEATVKKFYPSGEFVTLMPHSNNPKHQPIIVTGDFQIQGIVIATIPKISNQK